MLKRFGSVLFLWLWVITFGISPKAFSSSPENLKLLGKSIPIKNQFEIGAFVYDVSVRNSYVAHSYAAHATFGYHFLDWLALEAYGGYVFLHRESSVLTAIREDLSTVANTDTKRLVLPGIWQTQWSTGLSALWAPFYGKISFFSEWESKFQTYFILGAGADGVVQALGNQGEVINGIRFCLNGGLGLRLFLSEHAALRAEVKESVGFNPVLQNGNSDVSSTTWIQTGVSFLF